MSKDNIQSIGSQFWVQHEHPGFLLHVFYVFFLEVELKSNTAILPLILLNAMSMS